jgi:hypothetical protein
MDVCKTVCERVFGSKHNDCICIFFACCIVRATNSCLRCLTLLFSLVLLLSSIVLMSFGAYLLQKWLVDDAYAPLPPQVSTEDYNILNVQYMNKVC